MHTPGIPERGVGRGTYLRVLAVQTATLLQAAPAPSSAAAIAKAPAAAAAAKAVPAAASQPGVLKAAEKEGLKAFGELLDASGAGAVLAKDAVNVTLLAPTDAVRRGESVRLHPCHPRA